MPGTKNFKYRIINDLTGIQEHFTVYFNPALNEDVVKITTALDVLGKISNPYAVNQSLGFIPLKQTVASMEDVTRFINSHKPLYVITKDISVICDAVLRIDATTRELKSTSKIKLYTPMSLGAEDIVCTTVDGGQIPIAAYNALVEGFKKDVMQYDLNSRELYIGTRVLK